MRIGFFGIGEQEKKDYLLSSLTDHQVIFIDGDLNDNSLPENTEFEIISVFVQSQVTQKVIDALPNLKLITVRSTGYDNVDLKYAKSKNIIVSNVSAYGSHTVAEFAFGLILSLSRKIPQAIIKVKTEVEFDHQGLKGFDLYGKTLGVIGTGRIGANVIKIAQGFGMIVLAYDAFPNEGLAKSFEFHYMPLDDVLKEADIVTIHVPANPETKHLINAGNIFKMKKGAILINTARGDIVETDALYKAISEGHLAGAGLDVLEAETQLSGNISKEEFEPMIMKNILEDSYLIKDPRVIVTPHTAFYTTEAEKAIIQTTIENIQAFIKGQPQNIVNV